MTCEYYECGWCYSPENVETNAVQGGCFEPEWCPYFTNNRKMLDEKGHLECEIKELQLEIEHKAKAIGNLKGILERREQQLKEMNDSTNRLKEPNCVPKVIDENTIVIDGVEYKKVIRPTLYDTLLKKHGNYPMGRVDVCNIVRGWLIDHTVIESESAEMVTFTIHKDQLQTPK